MKQAVRAIIIKDDQLLVMKRNKFGMQYCTLIGGGVDMDEGLEAALRRELREEAGLSVGAVRHVFTEEAGEPYGTQYVFMCEYQGGEPVLSADSDEAQISQMGQNLYEPTWLPLKALPDSHFISESIKQAILEGVAHGFPETPQTLAWKYTPVSLLTERKGE